MDNNIWNPWHGCKRYSEGCKNCYVYRRDLSIGKDPTEISKTKNFDYIIKKKRDGSYLVPSGADIFLCMTSDFFIEEADEWRPDIWKMIKERQDVSITIITKRIERFLKCIPDDWGEGYDNVSVCCTIENQHQCDIRFPIFNSVPIKHKFVVCEPLLSAIDMRRYLTDDIKQVLCGGESGNDARVCDYDWILDIRQQASEAGVDFYFKQTGAKFLFNGKIYNIPRKFQHSQAKKANINIQRRRYNVD